MKIGLGFDKHPEPYDCIATFIDVSGIEGEYIVEDYETDEYGMDLCELTLFHCDVSKEEFINRFTVESKQYERSAFIYILSQKGEILGANIIDNIEISEIFADSQNNLNVKITGWLQSSSKGFYKITKKYFKHGIRNSNEWKRLPPEHVQGWLEAARRFRTKTEDIEHKIIKINSEGLDDKKKFYCALGEAVNGPLGYFGSNLDALDDCLKGDFGIKGDFTLNWLGHRSYKEKFPKYFDLILSVFSDNQININLL